MPDILSTPQAPVSQPSPSKPVSDKRFVFAPELHSVLNVEKVRLRRSQEGYLEIQVNVQNRSDVPQQFNYRIVWFDKDGNRLSTGAERVIPWMLLPREMTSIVATSPSLIAVDFGIAFLPNSK